jgi:hypothetical protein
VSRRPGASTLKELILAPALITLGVTALRLTGELMHWSPRWFSREAGGAFAIVGIVWLVPVFGIYFALRLARMGLGPAGRVRAVALSVASLLVLPAVTAAIRFLDLAAVGRIMAFNVAALLGLAIAYLAWPALGATLVGYGLAARIPVALVMLVAITQAWGTHYELGPPGLPEMGLLTKWVVIGLVPQLAFWLGFTVVIGGICGSIAAALVQGKRPAQA